MESGASSVIAGPPHDTANWYRIFHTMNKTISAVLYLLDFGSNIYTAYSYYQYDYRSKEFEGLSNDPDFEDPDSPVNFNFGLYSGGFFVSMVVVMAVGHISWAIVFKLVDFPGEKHPLALAYFFPFVQLRRVLCTLFNRSSKRSPTPQDKREEARVEALYAIVSATTDGGPLFLLQYLALAEFSLGAETPWTPAVWLIVSLCLSATSATWNVTRAIVYLVPSPSKRLAVATGAFTLSALTVRCTTLVSLVAMQAVLDDVSGWQFYVTLGIYLLFILIVPFLGNFFLTWEDINSKFNCRTLGNLTLRAVGFTYVSLSFGPLYPFVSVAQTSRRMGFSTKRFQYRMLFCATGRWVLETTIMTFLITKKWSPCVHEGAISPYQLCPMMPCFLYITALTVGLSLGTLSTATFMKFITEIP